MIKKILVLFGTRPEIIKLAPVIAELKKRQKFEICVVSSSQHTNLLKPFLKLFDIKTDYDLKVMTKNQTPNGIAAKVLGKLDAILAEEKPDVVLVQGDTTTALAGALAAFNRKITVGHIEAGLRSGNTYSPFPEEMNRSLISKIASFHFAATEKNRRNLLKEGVNAEKIFVTGNPIVDTLEQISDNLEPSKAIFDLITKTDGLKRILLTTHRRESFGEKMTGNLKAIRNFINKRLNTCLIFPVHPNPNVQEITNEVLGNHERVFLLQPTDYVDFIALMKSAWLIVSDSGGVQEEAPSLGKPLLVIRENTERPEAIESRIAKLVGESPKTLQMMLEENYSVESWINSVKKVNNPFGDGKAAQRIVNVLANAK
ncbi:MAG: UDP-N-acetylglucosamine 2-epimerase (non-hydrolyzing) [Pyrinomonadaceae bacterium]|jgi:UDP-N-acetylglucosamine 2-epimerase (non-hydrolysing)|nr:UDP-N-acetylglucosamine 2-epimerase (non-hydrolyzing) [Pyrinomonadaceae bacterium]